MNNIAILIAIAFILDVKSMASTANESQKPSSPRFDCKMSKSMNTKKSLKIDPQKGSLRFEIPYSAMDCGSQSYELKVNSDSLIIIQHDKMGTCMRHMTGYFLVGKIEDLNKGIYHMDVVQTIGAGIRYSLIKKPIVIEIP
jgi:hypothetical protein